MGHLFQAMIQIWIIVFYEYELIPNSEFRGLSLSTEWQLSVYSLYLRFLPFLMLMDWKD